MQDRGLSNKRQGSGQEAPGVELKRTMGASVAGQVSRREPPVATRRAGDRHSREVWGGMPERTGSEQSGMGAEPAGRTAGSWQWSLGSCSQESWQGLKRTSWEQ